MDDERVDEDLATSMRHQFLRDNYGVPDGTIFSDDPCAILSRLCDHWYILSGVASNLGSFDSRHLRQNDQLVCADVCLNRLISISNLKISSSVKFNFVDAVWRRFVELHKILTSTLTSRDESDALYLMYFTSSYLSAANNCNGRGRIIIDDFLLPQMRRIGLGQHNGQPPNYATGLQVVELLERAISDRV